MNCEQQNDILYYLIKKVEDTYRFLVVIILNLCHMNNICLNRKFLPIDFEQVAILAIK